MELSETVIYDCLIIGGGPAGLSAAIYMGRFLRPTLVLDHGEGRSSFEQTNDNYLGFPDGIKVKELRALGIRHAERFGVKFERAMVERMERAADGSTFLAHAGERQFQGRTVILCTGVHDVWPDIPNVLEYVGKTLFWCIACDGFRAAGKPVVVFGHDDDAATTALQFLAFSPKVTIVSSPGRSEYSREKQRDLDSHGVAVLEGAAAGVAGTPNSFHGVRLADGRVVPGEIMFSQLGCVPHNRIALDLNVDCTPAGYVRVDDEGYTSIPGVFAAGDLSRPHSHLVIAAAHEGAEAAQSANYYLYSGFQKE